MREQELQTAGADYTVALQQSVALWAHATTSASSRRRHDLLRDKQRIVRSFFQFCLKLPGAVTPADVQAWLADLRENRGAQPGTLYQHACLLASFYSWALRDSGLAAHLPQGNPARRARPKAPKAYQSESVKALEDAEMRALIGAVKTRAEQGTLAGLRDYALLLLYLATGLRRSEVINLRGKDVTVEEKRLLLEYQAKGGNYRRREVAAVAVRAALLEYLTAAGRLKALGTDAPLWVRHDRGARAASAAAQSEALGKSAQSGGEPKPPQPPKEAALTSHCLVKNLQRDARAAGIRGFHLHRTRHTYARMVSELTGDLGATQEALEHAQRSTTRVYVQRITVKRDPYSSDIASRWQNEPDTQK